MLSQLAFLISLAAGLVDCASRTSAPAGALTVGKSGAQYTKVQDAVNALSTTSTSAQSIFIKPGTYNEQVYIPARKAQLTIYGSTTDTTSYKSNSVTITNSIGYAATNNDDLTATVRNWAANTKFYNLNIANTAGASGAQALALSAYAGNQGYYGMQLTGYQDTLLSETGAQVYAKSYISGAVDFIFGQHATTWFDQINIACLARSGNGEGTITANGRSSTSDASIYVINNSTIAAASGQSVASGEYYLGRPWTEYARVVFQETSMTNVINGAGWIEWSSSSPNTADVTFEEYGNSGAGASGSRASFSKKIGSPISIASVLGSGYTSWVDTSYLS